GGYSKSPPLRRRLVRAGESRFPPALALLIPLVEQIERALTWVFVVAEPSKAGAVPNSARGSVVVAHFDHELRAQCDPLEVAPAGPATGLGRSALAGLKWCQQGPHAAFGLHAEAGDMANRAQLVAVV